MSGEAREGEEARRGDCELWEAAHGLIRAAEERWVTCVSRKETNEDVKCKVPESL